MLILLLIFIVVFIILAIVLAAGTLGIQGYIYSEPVANIAWRAVAAGAAIAFFLGLWALIDYKALDPAQADFPIDTLFRFNPTEIREVDKFWSVKAPSASAEDVQKNSQKILYTRRDSGGQVADYVDAGGRRWERSDPTGLMVAIVVDDKGQELRFEPKLVEMPNPNDPKGPKIKVFAQTSEVFPGYYQTGGRRQMLQLGVVSLFRWWLFLGNLVFNALFLGVWFICLWLILRFQWTHALSLAVLLWLTASLVVVPMLLAKTAEVARQRASAPVAAVTCSPKCA